MKAILSCIAMLLVFLHISNISFSQAPAQFNFQGIARGSSGAVLRNKDVGVRFAILSGSPTGLTEYKESRIVRTDTAGVFNAVIGGASASQVQGNLNSIVWNSGTKYLQIELDTANSGSFVNLGATQLLSVPFALFSNKSASAESAGNYFFEAVYGTQGHLEAVEGVHDVIFPKASFYQNPADSAIPSIDQSKAVYDTITGVFNAPESGMYQFDFEAMNYGVTPDFHFTLRRNGKSVRVITPSQYETSVRYPYATYNIAITLRRYALHTRIVLSKNDKVNIAYEFHALDGNPKYAIESAFPNPASFPDAVYNYFSGYKIN